MTIDPRMQEIITALLDTTGRTEAEAIAAGKKAAKLMAKLGLTEEQIMAKAPDMHRSISKIDRWGWIITQYILNPISDLTGTKVWFEILPTASGKRSDNKNIHIAGFRSDVDQATWLFNHIVSAAANQSRGMNVTDRNSFLVGFGGAVRKRIKELIDSYHQERPDLDPTKGTNLVVVKSRQVEDYQASLVSNLRSNTAKGTKAKAWSAYGAGAAAGQNVTLGRPVSGNGPRAIAG